MATKKERQRQLARQAHARRMQRRAERQHREKQIAVAVIVAVIVVAVGIGGAAAAGAFSTKHKPKPDAAANSSTTPAATTTPTPTPSPSSTPAMVDGKCLYIKSGTASRKVSLPKAKPDTKATYTATIKTNRGDIKIDLLNSKAPCTVNSFVSLADQGFYNNTPCPRLVTSGIYVLQCGDPTGTGSGGPGYGFNSENLTGATYPANTVAMANSGTPDSNGSQFFLVFKSGSQLSPDYTPFGTIVSGLNILQQVAAAGGASNNPAGGGTPHDKVQIERVTIKKT